MPLYGGEPYYSPDDITQELFTTQELPIFQSLHLYRHAFWKKWKLWIIGASIVISASTGTFLGVVEVHDCCEVVPPAAATPDPPKPTKPQIVQIPRNTKTPTPERTPSP